MVYFRINELLKKKRKVNIGLLKIWNGGYQSLSHLMNNETKAIHFDTLEKMCNLFECEIGELVEIRKDKRKEKIK